jgi:hypothetical protein
LKLGKFEIATQKIILVNFDQVAGFMLHGMQSKWNQTRYPEVGIPEVQARLLLRLEFPTLAKPSFKISINSTIEIKFIATASRLIFAFLNETNCNFKYLFLLAIR